MSTNEWIAIPATVASALLQNQKKLTKLEALTHILMPFQDYRKSASYRIANLCTAFGWQEKTLKKFIDDLIKAGLFTVIYGAEQMELTIKDEGEYEVKHLTSGKVITEKLPKYEIGQTFDLKNRPDLTRVPPEASVKYLDDGRWQIVPDPIVSCPDEFDPESVVKMKRSEWEQLIKEFGETEAAFLACELQQYSTVNPRKFASYKSHYLTLKAWRRMKVSRGFVFKDHEKYGWGYYMNQGRNGSYAA